MLNDHLKKLVLISAISLSGGESNPNVHNDRMDKLWYIYTMEYYI